MNILIGSDVVPTKVNIELFENGDVDALLGNELKEIWNTVDFRMFNLETPITSKSNPILKNGSNFMVHKNVINGIEKLKPSLVTLANNHILDQGKSGLLETIKLLKDNHINHIGAGENLHEAKKPYVLKYENLKVGVYTCAEHEFTIATELTAGANPFDPLESLDHISELKRKCDYVIVLYHGGKEYYRYPSPYLQKVCRKIIEKGADLVVCQHSHTIGAFEKYRNGKIVYGQGNFIFNKDVNEHWNTGLLLKVSIKESLQVNYIPFKRSTKGIELANEREKKEILDGFYKRSEQIITQEFIQSKYNEFADDYFYKYLRAVSSQGKWLSRLDRRIFKNNLLKITYNQKKLLALKNFIKCEAHRELFLNAIKENIKSE